MNSGMKIVGTFLWLLLGGIETAIIWFSIGIILLATIIGFRPAKNCFKIAFYLLNPIDKKITIKKKTRPLLNLVALFVLQDGSSTPYSSTTGFIEDLAVLFHGIWSLTFGLILTQIHILFGLILSLTLVGIPLARIHFDMASVAWTPFSTEVTNKSKEKV